MTVRPRVFPAATVAAAIVTALSPGARAGERAADASPDAAPAASAARAGGSGGAPVSAPAPRGGGGTPPAPRPPGDAGAAPVIAPGEVIVVTGIAPRDGVDDLDGPRAAHADAARALAEPAFVTVVHVADRDGETVSPAEVLAESAGVHTRSLGGLGAFASVSIRGAAPGHTAVLVDGVPLSRLSSAAADLGAFELASFDRVELYRGGVPVDFGGAALGGAVQFVTAAGRPAGGDSLRLSAGVGSFGARHLRLRWRDDLAGDALGVHVAAGYRGADGDYPFFDDNGTPLRREDDTTARRSNNGFDQVDAVARARWRGRAWSVAGGARALHKAQGIPGVGSAQTERAALATTTAVSDVTAVRATAGATVRATGYALVERQHLADPLGEVGLGSDDARSLTIAAGATAVSAVRVGTRHRVELAAEARGEQFSARDRDRDARVRALRGAAAASVAGTVALWGGRALLVPAVRVDVLRTEPGGGWDPLVVGAGEVGDRTEWFASPRLAARVRVARAWVAKASAGRYFRPPTVVEVFGDRGVLVGDPALRAETGVSADVGVAFAPSYAVGPVDRIYGQLAAFGARARDTIAFQPTAGRAAVAMNLGDADLGGVEAAATARLWRTATASIAYTFLDSRQRAAPTQPSYDGKRLPQRPRHELYARADVALRVAGRLAVVWADATVTSGNFLDAANLNEVPPRTFVGVGAKVSLASGVLVGVEVKNVADRRVETVTLDPPPRPDLSEIPRAVADVLGYPLPGRSVYLTIDWSVK